MKRRLPQGGGASSPMGGVGEEGGQSGGALGASERTVNGEGNWLALRG